MFGTPTTFAKQHHKSTRTSSQYGPAPQPLQIPGKGWRKLFYATLAITSSLLGIWMMFEILRPNGMTPLEYCLLGLFSITYAWIASSFCSALIGFVLQWFRIDPMTLSRHYYATPKTGDAAGTRTAVVMPIYNEDTERVLAGFKANIRSLLATGQAQHFDFYLLSDTQNPAIITAESEAWTAFKQQFGQYSSHCFYRRREKNSHRKVGNLMDFCERWGNHYDHMLVLDADSLMTGDCMLALVHAMAENPQTGLIQTVPIPVRATTFFGRFVQFASTLYSPMLATGLTFWQTDSANYWGHNAILRTQAFIDHCGLPSLKAKKGPFSGEILSHDFVEAALMRRAGWEVWLLPELDGSYEEVPSNVLDYATRDRRWAEGNIQHLSLLPARGLRLMSKLHFLFGAIAYLSSLFWLLMLALSSLDAVLRALNANVFFQSAYQLFPDWPIAKTEFIVTLLYVTAVLLLMPKVMGLILALRDRRQQFGGVEALLRGTAVETLFAILIAPLMMVFHAYFVLSILIGRKVSWNPQPREGRMVSWPEALARTLFATLAVSAWGSLVWLYAPTFFWWMTPVVLGLVLAAPIVRYSSSLGLGQSLRQAQILLTPSEVVPPPLLIDLEQTLQRAVANTRTTDLTAADAFALPPERPVQMPIQSFSTKLAKPLLASQT